MTDHTENSLHAVISSLRTIVAPAVDTSNPLAQQQLQLALAYLDFLRSRLPNLPDRDRFELLHNVRLAESALEALGNATPTEELAEAVAEGRRITETAGATRVELRRAAAVLAAGVSELIESDLEEEARRSLELAVVTDSAERVNFDRVWYQPMGFDPEPDSSASLDELLPTAAINDVLGIG